MIWGAFRIGRYAVRAGRYGARPGPARARQPLPPLGRLMVAALIIGVWWAVNWRSLAITAGVGVLFVTPLAWLAGTTRLRTARARRRNAQARAYLPVTPVAPEECSDPLARLQARYGITEEER